MFFREDRLRLRRRTKQRYLRQGVADLVPWAGLVAPGVVVNKQGTFTGGWTFRAPDLESSTKEELQTLGLAVNQTLSPLQNEWMLHVDAIRRPSSEYAGMGAFPDPVTALIDEERRRQYEAEGDHFESRYLILATWWPATERTQRASSWFLTGPTESGVSWDREIERFDDNLRHIENTLAPHLAISRLDSEGLLRHLHYCLTGNDHPVEVPEIPFYIDYLLATQDFHGGFHPLIGRKRCYVISVNAFPRKSKPALLDFLHQLPVSYRWSTRWMPMSRQAAVGQLNAVRRNWFKSRWGLMKHIRAGEVKSSAERYELEQFANQDAVHMYRDGNQALAEASSGLVTYGYYTNTIVLQHEDERLVAEAAQKVEKAVQQQGLGAQIEEANSVDAFMGSLPGNYTDNVRRPIIHTLNLAHLMPLTSIFSGLQYNPSPMFPEKSPPVFLGKTTGATPYRAHLHVGDVGHVLVVGPTGAGKSVLLTFAAAQFLRFPNAQVFMFDRGYSAMPICLATGGAHYDLMAGRAGTGPSFCPLGETHKHAERMWGASWLAGLFELQGITLEPRHHEAIHLALEQLGDAPRDDRTLTNLLPLLQSQRLREGIRPYTLDGDFGALLDAKEDGFTRSHFHVFELSRLLDAGERIVAPTLAYLFHRIETKLEAGVPTFIPVDEAWAFLMHGQFARQIRSWVKEARKKNAAVLLATQSIDDVDSSREAQIIYESCPTKIFLPNEEALTPRGARFYEQLGLNPRQIQIIGHGTKKRDYYWISPAGRRLIELQLGDVALSFLGATDPESLRTIRQLQAAHGARWPIVWLRERNLDAWAQRLESELTEEVSV